MREVGLKKLHILPLRSCYSSSPTCQEVLMCTYDALSLLSAPVTRAPKTPTMRAAAMIAYMIVPEIIGAGMASMVEKQTCYVIGSVGSFPECA